MKKTAVRYMTGIGPMVGAAAAVVIWPTASLAYTGPGAGLAAIGVLLGVLASIAIAIFGLVWYPVKRLLRALRKDKGEKPAVEADTAEMKPAAETAAPAPDAKSDPAT